MPSRLDTIIGECLKDLRYLSDFFDKHNTTELYINAPFKMHSRMKPALSLFATYTRNATPLKRKRTPMKKILHRRKVVQECVTHISKIVKIGVFKEYFYPEEQQIIRNIGHEMEYQLEQIK